MKCPICKLINPPTALRCDCGYNFETHEIEVEKVPKSQKQKKEISPMLLVLLCLGLFSLFTRFGGCLVDVLK